VIGTENGATTVYIGNYYEWHGTITDTIKYYYAGAERVAMKTGTTDPQGLVGDHLGSTSVVANYDGTIFINGTTPARQGYKAWGEQRFPTGASPLPTTFRYTGQREAASFGLYFYGARWYDATLGRFTQPDTIVPETSQGVQAWDRYAYGSNNPSRFIDPSGRSTECAIGDYGCRVGVLDEKGLWKLYQDAYHLDPKAKTWTPGQRHGFALYINEVYEYRTKRNEQYGENVTEAQKIGKGITATLVTFICSLIEVGLVKTQIAGLQAGIPGWILDVVILIPEWVVIDFEVSFDMMIYKETGYDAHEVDFEWILSNIMADLLPETLHDDLVVSLPKVFH
jgi:RHS repeat-associated protein